MNKYIYYNTGIQLNNIQIRYTTFLFSDRRKHFLFAYRYLNLQLKVHFDYEISRHTGMESLLYSYTRRLSSSNKLYS
jgi:hypothetical protein